MKTKLVWLEVVLLAAPLIALALYWNDLPARVPTHWDLRGQIDGWMSKVPGILILPLTALGITALLHILPWFDPKLRRTPGEEGLMPAVMPIVRLATLVLLDAIFLVQMATSLGRNVAAGRIMMTCLLLFFVILGNYLGNLRPNYFVGIRTPWTLENPETWRATHRLGGRLMFFGGLVLLLAQALLSESAFGLLFIGSILTLAAWGFIYSWHHSRTHVRIR
ncbi:MAG: SdpI family protein [Verrucomicrobiota bacterium]|nr:SdpI family protein [Chthoniobacterales bacterium]MDQ3413611.1 SdpI family protein [Verrucomicrobiota bacterium]